METADVQGAANDEPAEPVFGDGLFRQKRKKGKYRVVPPPIPALEAPVADTHAHVQMLADPAAELARCAVHGVGFVACVVDPSEDGDDRGYGELAGWREGATARAGAYADGVRGRMAGERETTEGGSERDEAAVSAVPACDLLGLRVPDVRFIVGVHPHNAKDYEGASGRLRELLADPRTAALGEIGLDYHYDLSPRDVQRQVFRDQIRLAKEAGLPIALHVREAHDDAFAILGEEGFPAAGTLLHCFNLDEVEVARWVEAGCFVAFGGPLTFKAADDVRRAAARVPRNRLLTETDSPYMTPEPMRGMPCGPAHTVFTAACLAEVLGCTAGAQRQQLLEQLMANARGLLDRAPTAWQLAYGKGDDTR